MRRPKRGNGAPKGKGSKYSGGSYEVGFGKPPKSGQFKPGESGNPQGRKKKSKDFESAVRNTMDLTFTVKLNGEDKQMSVLEALLAKACVQGMSGDPRMMKLVLELFANYKLPEAEKIITHIRRTFVSPDGRERESYATKGLTCAPSMTLE